MLAPFRDNAVPLDDKAGLVKALATPAPAAVQYYGADSQVRGAQAELQGIQWLQHHFRGQCAAALGTQRSGPLGKFALPDLLPRP